MHGRWLISLVVMVVSQGLPTLSFGSMNKSICKITYLLCSEDKRRRNKLISDNQISIFENSGKNALVRKIRVHMDITGESKFVGCEVMLKNSINWKQHKFPGIGHEISILKVYL